MDKRSEVALSDESSESQLELSMMISTYGVPNQIEVTSSPQSLTEDQLGKLRKDMRSKRFRPKLVNGLAAEAPHSMLYDQPTPKG